MPWRCGRSARCDASQGLLDAASVAFEESLRQTVRLHADSPGSDEYLFELGQSEFWVGQTALERNDLATAAAALGRYMEHGRALVERDPDNADYQRELAYAYSNLGTMARKGRRPGEALAYFQSSAAIEQRLLAASPDDAELRYSLAESHSWAGTCLLDLGRLDDSEQSFLRALDLVEALHRKGGNPHHGEEYADVGALLAGVLANRGAAARAVAGESGRETLRLNAALIADSYGRLLDATGNPGRAADVWSEALRSLAAESVEGPGLVQHALRARLIAQLGRKDEARRMAEDLRRSGFADPRLPLPPDLR